MSDKRTLFYGAGPQIFEKAKKLRDNMTKHEVLLCNELSNQPVIPALKGGADLGSIQSPLQGVGGKTKDGNE